MHSNESAPAPATGPALLSQLGRLIVRARSTSPAHAQRRRHKLIADPSTSHQVQQTQPRPDAEPSPRVVAQLDSHVHALWSDHIPLCIEILLGPDCGPCHAALCAEAGYDKPHAHAPRPLLLERWTMRVTPDKSEESSPAITPHWLLNAVRSQLHFSQLSAWRATIQSTSEDKPAERRRKLSRETCNFKKVEANCDESDLERKLNLIYSIRLPGESYEIADFSRPPARHLFPVTELGGARLAVRLESLPRLATVPRVRCACRSRRPSLPPPAAAPDDLAAQLGGLTLGPRPPDPVDDRMLTPCSESGKHRCSCDDESDTNRSPPAGGPPGEPDERRLREIAKYKRRLRKESKLRRLCDSTSSEGDGARRETHTSIPILQAARFDRLRALGGLRRYAPPGPPAPAAPPAPRTRTVATQTDAPPCACGAAGMRRSDGTYDLAALEGGARRKRGEDDGPSTPDCDSSQCDSKLDNASFKSDIILKRPKLRRHFPPTDRIERVVSDRLAQSADMRELNLRDDDSVFSAPRPEPKRQKTYSVGDDYVCYEKCDYGTVDELAAGGAGGGAGGAGGGAGGAEVPSPTEMDRFRWRFDSAASMVFHHKTGLPLTSSPAPLRRGNTCFDFDDSINGVSGIKSALFHGPAPPSPPPAPPRAPRPRHGPSSGLLGSFEESALKGRLEPVATVAGFSAELGASGAFCPPHRRLPVTVFFYAPGGTNAPYMGHINLGAGGYRVARSGTIQVSLFNPHGTLVKMFVVLYDLTAMPPHARTFLRQRTLYMPAGAPPPTRDCNKWLRYLIHLRFMTSRSGKLYLHTDIRIIVSRKADLDTATAHSALFRPIAPPSPTDELTDGDDKLTNGDEKLTNGDEKLINSDEKLTNGDEKLTNGDAKLKYVDDKWSNGIIDYLANGSGEKVNNGSVEKLINGNVDKLTNGSTDKLANGSVALTNGSAALSNDSVTLTNGSAALTHGIAALSNASVALTNGSAALTNGVVTRAPNRVFGGCGEFEASAGVPYELRSFTYAPDNPRFSPR